MLQAWLLSHAFRATPSWVARLLSPVSWVYGALQRGVAHRSLARAAASTQPERPVIVVGNYIVGGAGKTPVTLALLEALRAAGHLPGVVSRGHGRRDNGIRSVEPGDPPELAGDEPLLIRRRAGVPVVVGTDRRRAALELLARNPDVTVIVSDDGLQHRGLRRDAAIVVFDERGVGNGRLLPAGPLREPLPVSPPPDAWVVYSHGQASTAWPGWPLQRRLSGACPLAEWLAGRPHMAALSTLRGREHLAVAGIAVPERFFADLEQAGLTVRRLPRPDHAPYSAPPWPHDACEVLVTEKDAVKLARWTDTGAVVRVVPLDLELPVDLVSAVLSRLPPPNPSPDPP